MATYRYFCQTDLIYSTNIFSEVNFHGIFRFALLSSLYQFDRYKN